MGSLALCSQIVKIEKEEQMRNSNLALVCLLGVMLVAPAAVMAGSFSFSDNFEDGDISDWTTFTDGTGVVEASMSRSTGAGGAEIQDIFRWRQALHPLLYNITFTDPVFLSAAVSKASRMSSSGNRCVMSLVSKAGWPS